jgi:hypothetical protein
MIYCYYLFIITLIPITYFYTCYNSKTFNLALDWSGLTNDNAFISIVCQVGTRARSVNAAAVLLGACIDDLDTIYIWRAG